MTMKLMLTCAVLMCICFFSLPVYRDRLNCLCRTGHQKDLTLSSVVVLFVQQHIPAAVPLTTCWVFLSPKNGEGELQIRNATAII
jgi:hypothetical protein